MARFAFFALASAYLTSTVLGYRPGDEVCVVSADNDCSLNTLKQSKLDGSTLIYPGGKTRCAFNDWSNPASNFSTNATYFFQVFPAPQQAAKPVKLLLYLQGGGACVDNFTCSFAFQCASGSPTFYANAKALSTGVLNRSEPSNIFNDWNIVHVPYCTSDIHIGNATHPGTDQGFEAIFQQPACLNQNQTLHQNGYVNTQTVFDWALKNFPDVEHLALSGSSAGALGAQIYAKAIADKWKVAEKKTKFSVLADSYVGVAPDDKPGSTLLSYFKACSLPWGLPDKVVADCENASATTAELVAPIIKATNSYADWFYADSMGDRTQRLFYEILNQGILAYPFQNMLSAQDLYTNMTEILESYEDDTPKLAWFFESGERHVFFTLNNWTQIPSADNKTTLGETVRSILVGNFTYETGSGSSVPPGGSSNVPAPASSSAPLSAAATTLVAALVACLMNEP